MNIWEALTQNKVFEVVESVIGEPLTNVCLQRNSYINRVYELEKQDGSRLIVKFYRPNRWSKPMILNEHAMLLACSKQEIPVIPPLSINNQTLHDVSLGVTVVGTEGDAAAEIAGQVEGIAPLYFALFPKKGGRVLDEFEQDLWKEAGRLLARVHIACSSVTSTRHIWTPQKATTTHLKSILSADKNVRKIHGQGFIPPGYEEALTRSVQAFIAKAEPLFHSVKLQPIHGDCHFGNLIYRPDESLYLVDFDDSVVGPSIQDVWMLLPDTPEHCAKELAWFKEGYQVFLDFPSKDIHLIPALQIMRQLHFCAWSAMQYGEPRFSSFFPNWGTTAYWNELVRDVQAF